MASEKEYKKEISAGIIVYRKTKAGPKFLLMYHGGGYWNFPKGRLEAGEENMKAAFREVGEETGIKAKDLFLDKDFTSTDKYFPRERGEKISKTVTLFLARTNVSQIKISFEHDGFAWSTFREALKIMKYKGSKKILKQAYKYLKI